MNPALYDPVPKLELPDKFAVLSGQKIIVTGAAGFIGGALFRRLVGYGLDVTATVQFPDEVDEMKRLGLQAEQLDLSHSPLPAGLFKDVNLVFHVAAMFQETEAPPAMYERVNDHAVVEMAKMAREAGVRRFVHCSTVGVHGDVAEIPAKETSPYNPMDVYHETKLAGELSIRELASQITAEEMTIVVNRPAMVYGPGDTRMLKLFRAIDSGKFFMIGDGETLAHMGYIEDQVDSFIDCAIAPSETVHGEPFNIASGEPVTLNELARSIAEETGQRIPRWKIPLTPVLAAGRVCEVVCRPLRVRPPLSRRRVGFFTHNRAFDLSKARDLLGYESRWGLEEGIRETMRWYRKHKLVSARAS